MITLSSFEPFALSDKLIATVFDKLGKYTEGEKEGVILYGLRSRDDKSSR